ncbi:azurin [Gelidibacter gilvus]|uniref:Azurin n=1 Tax=Gelidibacter gilvus TaxID=59602 RepID=A0A4Q0XC15_9FLAO|nr:azurin [Gelidibacter gilvus]RXJ45432.1 azurin [Gelidibacter gilvus]
MKKLILVFLVALAFSCGDKKKETPVTTTDTKVEKKAPVEDPNVAVLTIEGNDQMQFNKKELRVKAGQKIKLTLKHVGKMDMAVMGHNWALLTQDADVATVGNAAAMAKDNDYIPADMTDKIIVHTKMIGGGQTTTIEFDAPAAGTYTYMCTFPGHYALMQGKLIVE